MKRKRGKMQHLTPDELKSLLAQVYNARETNNKLDRLHRKALVLVTYWHGLRNSEAINLTAADIADGYVSVQRLKGSECTIQEYVKHPDPELDESAVLAEVSKLHKRNEHVFPITRFGFYRLINRAAIRAGLPPHKRHPHMLKHTCAMVAMKAGVNVAQTRLGHKSGKSTLEYTKLDDVAASAAFAAVACGGYRG